MAIGFDSGNKIKEAIDTLFNGNVDGSINGENNDRGEVKKFKTLDVIKEIHNADNYLNPYLKLVQAHNKEPKNKDQQIKFSYAQMTSIMINEILVGNRHLYKDVVFRNTLELITKKLTEEIVKDFNIFDDGGKIQVGGKVLYFDAENFDIETMINKALIYGKVGIKANINNGSFTFEFLEPYKYFKEENGVKVLQIIENKLLTLEERFKIDDSLVIINGEAREDIDQIYFYELELPTYTTKGIEVIFEYDVINTALTKETLINSSKLFGDMDYFKKNPINTDFIETIDMPEGLKIGEDKQSATLTQMTSTITLSEKLELKNSKANELAVGYGLNKKTLGIDSSSQDFATSLQYENDSTASTINAYRKLLTDKLEAIIKELTGITVDLQFGEYKLDSSEQRAQLNAKCNGFLGIRDQIAQYYDLPIDDEKVILASWRWKNDNGKTPDYVEEELAKKYGLIPATEMFTIDSMGDGEDGTDI